MKEAGPPDSLLMGVPYQIWDTKYRYRVGSVPRDQTLDESWRRIAGALASVEQDRPDVWAARFYGLLKNFRFLPGGRIQAGAGTAQHVTLFNCFVMGNIEDSLDGIFDALKEGALTMQQGGGVGYDFSTLRPHGALARRVGMVASGPVSFMKIWDSTCATILSTGARRGAMMATLRCDHPDIEAFIDAKREAGSLRNFNLSVQVTDDFMAAVRQDAEWPLVFPLGAHEPVAGEVVARVWPGASQPRPCKVLRRVRARALWHQMMRAAYDSAEPGVVFIDRVNRSNNLYYCERITATNPCGEVPLPPYGACDLGSINLTRFVSDPFGAHAALDMAGIRESVALAVRLLDNVYDISRFPLEKQRRVAHASRRIGLGITGLADALIMLGIRYGSQRSLTAAHEIMAAICHGAYRASIELARERGVFPSFDAEPYLAGAFVACLPQDIRDGIRRHGIRNSHVTAIAPTGTISLLAGNISSGLEPVFAFAGQRRVRNAAGQTETVTVSDYAYQYYRRMRGADAPLTDAFVRATEIEPREHLAMQSTLQAHVDNAISKTINIPENYPFDAFVDLYWQAYQAGLKGCTVFRPNPITGQVLQPVNVAEKDCCS